MTRAKIRSAAALGVLLILAAGCATTQRSVVMETAAPCADSVYVQLRRQHPDSLSERAAARLEVLDRECANARAQARTEDRGSRPGMFGMRDERVLGIGIMTVLMAAMMIRMW